MLASQAEQAQRLLEDFEMMDDWDDRYGYLIDLGATLPPLQAAAKVEDNRVHGCQSNVWMIATASEDDGERTIQFIADSDSKIVKGLIAVLGKVYSGQPPEKILSFDIDGYLRQLGLDQHLTLGRRNGLYGMVQRIKTLARSLAPEVSQT